jgi:DMSO/TMAO reductase YedYZ heme-binding membrane subunit
VLTGRTTGLHSLAHECKYLGIAASFFLCLTVLFLSLFGLIAERKTVSVLKGLDISNKRLTVLGKGAIISHFHIVFQHPFEET